MEQETADQINLCSKCGSYPNEDLSSSASSRTNKGTCDSESVTKCQQWLEKCSLSDADSEYSSSASTSSVCTSQGQTETSCEDVESSAIELLKPEHSLDNSDLVSSSPNNYGAVQVKNSKHVVIGNITYVTGPVNIIHASSTVNQETIVNQILLNDPTVTQKSEKLRIISRVDWLAQPALKKTPLPETPKYVVISHTASEEGLTQAKNTLLIRLVQTFHVEGREWDDIAYNFLVGSDGNVYEGRGWGLQGAHTFGYNKKSIGISFVGCFMDHLPPFVALNAAKALIKHGVELGYIPGDYVLVGHCQCSPVESPGRRLYEEIKTWPNWRELTTEDSA